MDSSYVATNSVSTPDFVFGYGLSYTNFEYSNFKYQFDETDNKVKLSFDIYNNGEYDGWKIAQCYISDVVASMARPIKELKAFSKEFIKKGEKKNVCFELCKDDLSFYDNRGKWIFEKGDFIIEIGKSCNDICFETTQYISFNK